MINLPDTRIPDETFLAKWGAKFDIQDALRFLFVVVGNHSRVGKYLNTMQRQVPHQIERAMAAARMGRRYVRTYAPMPDGMRPRPLPCTAETWLSPTCTLLPESAQDMGQGWAATFRKEISYYAAPSQWWVSITYFQTCEPFRAGLVPAVDSVDAVNAVLDYTRTEAFVKTCGELTALERHALHWLKLIEVLHFLGGSAELLHGKGFAMKPLWAEAERWAYNGIDKALVDSIFNDSEKENRAQEVDEPRGSS